ncbi:MAG: hypothetical protein H6838_02070 [Planctomycetes bacterium]|nr:hypothetical protein [Planctomycetota bacterium]
MLSAHIGTEVLRRPTLSAALVLAATLCLAGTQPLRAQAVDEDSSRHVLTIDSGLVANNNPAPAARGIPAVVWSTVVSVPTSSWLRLDYSGILLSGSREPGGDGSYLRISSLLDHHFQTQHLVHVEQWQQTSAYFNGDAVLVELLACPGTGPSRIMIGAATAGPGLPVSPDTICGPTDDRVLSSDPRAGRNQPTGCTSWLINDCNHCLLTAGHCAGSGLQVVEFNVPLSTSSGAIQHPAPQHQYAVDASSVQTNGGLGVGNDWTYFGVFANSTTGLTPHQANGGQAFDLLPTPPAVGSQSIRVTGYGSTTSPVSPTWYLVQKTHSGPYATFSGTTVQYVTDTTGGNSGSPVFLDGTNQAIGIHTHGGCNSTGGANSGTGSNHPGLQAALANPQGVCDCPAIDFTYPNGLPTVVDPAGTTVIRVQIGGVQPLQAGSVRLHISTGGPFVALTPVALGNGLFEATVPASPCLSPVQFYWSAQDTSSTTYTDPENAPTSTYSATSAGSLATIRSYNFNTTPAGWSVINTALTTGAWTRGVPVDSRGPAADYDASGQCWVTGNTNNEDVDGGPTQLRTETIDLTSNNDPVVRYALWFTNDDNDDFLVVEASQNGGASWVQIENLGPFVGWQMHGFRVLDHFATLGQLTVRFSVADNPNNSVTEAALDAFSVVDPICPQPTWSPYGLGCAPTGAAPALAMVSLPALGGTFALGTQNLGSGAPFMVTGFSAQALNLAQFGFGPACLLLVSVDAVQFAPAGSFTLTIPNNPSLAGLRLYNQVIELGSSAVSNAGVGEIR